MKNITKYIIYALLIVCNNYLISCKEDDNGDSNPPQQISEIDFIPLYGGGIFTYAVPEDPNFSYVKAVYYLNDGREMVRIASKYNNQIEVDGFGAIGNYDVKLYSVGTNGALSEPIVKSVTPLVSNTENVVNTVTVSPGFSSIICKWNNELEKPIDIVVKFVANGKEITKIKSSTVKNDRFIISGLSNESYKFDIYIRDKYENKSQVLHTEPIKPYIDYKLSKKQWNVVPDKDLPKGLKNANLFFAEGRIEYFWDDIIDDTKLVNMNYFHSGPVKFPFSYYIDLGRNVKASRFTINQREYITNTYYSGQNVESFDLYVSDDLTNWELIRSSTIVKPAEKYIADKEAKAGHSFIIYDDDPRFTRSFRYLQYKATKPFSAGGTAGCVSEITLYGVEESDF